MKINRRARLRTCLPRTSPTRLPRRAHRAHPASAGIPALATCLPLALSPRTCANHPQKREKAAGEAALFSDEWSEEKSLERLEE